MNIGINIEESMGVGDKVQFSCIPEAFYKWYGIKLIDQHRSWIFDRNPYVRRLVSDQEFLRIRFQARDGEEMKEPIGLGLGAFVYCKTCDWVEPCEEPISPNSKKIINLWSAKNHGGSYSRSRWFYKTLGIQDWNRPELCLPRGPRLYKHEDPTKVKPNQIAIHVGPSKSVKEQFIPPYVLKKISERYPSYNIIQIGSKEDNDSSFINKRGLKIWDSVKIIAESAIFIGINSGPMHIANCYPHISKKIILRESTRPPCSRAATFNPLRKDYAEFDSWIDFGWQYYNTLKFDAGRTYSYQRI